MNTVILKITLKTMFGIVQITPGIPEVLLHFIFVSSFVGTALQAHNLNMTKAI